MLTAALIIIGIGSIIAAVIAYACIVAGSNFDRMLEDAQNERPNSDDPHPSNIINSPVHPQDYADERAQNHVR